MSIELPDVRERVVQLDIFHSVADTLSAADAMETFSAVTPAAFVSTARETAAPNRNATGIMRQRVMQTVSILFVLAAERADGQGPDEAENFKNALVAQLVGWRPKGAEQFFQYVSYSVRFIGEGLFWGEVLITAPYYFTKVG